MDVMDVVRLSIRCHVGKRKEERRKRRYTQRKLIAQTTMAAGPTHVRVSLPAPLSPFLLQDDGGMLCDGGGAPPSGWRGATASSLGTWAPGAGRKACRRRACGRRGRQARATQQAARKEESSGCRARAAQQAAKRRAAARATADGVAGQPRTHCRRSPLRFAPLLTAYTQHAAAEHVLMSCRRRSASPLGRGSCLQLHTFGGRCGGVGLSAIATAAKTRRIGRGGHKHEREAVRPPRAEDGDRGGGDRSPDGKEGQGGGRFAGVTSTDGSRPARDGGESVAVARSGGTLAGRDAARRNNSRRSSSTGTTWTRWPVQGHAAVAR
jgi:hypothetical protein